MEGEALRDVARQFWGFSYDPGAGTVSLGPYVIRVEVADGAARDLFWAIYTAAREVDQVIAADLLARIVAVLAAAEITCKPSGEAPVWVRVKADSQVWLSLVADQNEHDGHDLAERIVRVLADDGLHLVSLMQAEDLPETDRLMRGEALLVKPDAT